MAATISNTDDAIDSLSIIDRIEELKGEREALQDDIDQASDEFDALEAELAEAEAIAEDEEDADTSELETGVHAARVALETATESLTEWDDSEEADELKVLKKLAADAEQYSADWIHGETLIHEDYWVEYCEELCKDIGDMPKEIPSYIVIDWEATADNLKMDYSEVDFDGEAYYIRSC